AFSISDAVLEELGMAVLLLVALLVIVFILNGIGRTHVLKELGSGRAWLGWIPYAGQICLGLHVKDEEGKIPVFGAKVNSTVVALWPVYVLICSYIPNVGSILGLVVSIILGGSVYAAVYAKMEEKDLSETRVLGYVTGWIGLVATVKFLIYRSRDKKR
ncbi:MAG: hypothetical protein LUH58_07720, partial [Lachnospiraceae bacterium]|nr:hypothetical protein [Lachnospiraceae bacterium]